MVEDNKILSLYIQDHIIVEIQQNKSWEKF